MKKRILIIKYIAGFLLGLFGGHSLPAYSDKHSDRLPGSNQSTPTVSNVESNSIPEPSLPQTKAADAPVKFHRQFGIGVSAVPINISSWVDQGVSYWASIGWTYTPGIQLDILGRLHPHITLELSLGWSGYPYSVIPARAMQFDVSAGVRFYLKHLKLAHHFSFHPYVVTAVRYELLIMEADLDSLTHFTQYLSKSGFVPGLGLEFRYREHVAFHIDFRTFFGGYFPSPSSSIQFATNLKLGLGVSYYF